MKETIQAGRNFLHVSFRWGVLALFLTLIVGGCKVQKESLSERKPLQSFYTLTFQKVDGTTLSGSDLKGKVVLINFWASWCGPCREEIPDLAKLYSDLKNENVVVLGVSVDESLEDAKNFLQEVHVSYPIVWDGPDGNIAKLFKGFAVLPTSYLLDASGVIRKRILGPRRYSDFKKMILEIKNQSSS